MLHLVKVDSVEFAERAVHIGSQKDRDAQRAHESGHARHITRNGDLLSFVIN